MCVCVCVCVCVCMGGWVWDVNSVIHYTSFSGGRKIGPTGNYETKIVKPVFSNAEQNKKIQYTHTHRGPEAGVNGISTEGNTRVLHFTQRHRLFYTSRAGLRSGQFSHHNS